jgi:hypothetical protein
MTPEEEITHLREVINVYKNRNEELLTLLEIAKILLSDNKNVIVMKKDDEFKSSLDNFLTKVGEHGI